VSPAYYAKLGHYQLLSNLFEIIFTNHLSSSAYSNLVTGQMKWNVSDRLIFWLLWDPALTSFILYQHPVPYNTHSSSSGQSRATRKSTYQTCFEMELNFPGLARTAFLPAHVQTQCSSRRTAQSPVRAIKKTPWPESTSELYRPSDRRLSAKWLPAFADKGCHVVSVTDPCGRILGFLDRSRYFSIK
jgi:hypothetical protein